jgi:GH43 family beta-xylosidase
MEETAMRLIVLVLAVCLLVGLSAGSARAAACAFRNPLIAQGQDPSVVYKDGWYYLVQSIGALQITKSRTITGLGSVQPVTVFTPPPGQPYSHDVWAPELVYLRGEWYIYVAATSAQGANPTHRMYVLKADTQDPLGNWTMIGKLYDPDADKWAIDGVAFEFNDQLYFVWSGWHGDVGDFPQNLYIATMSDPTTLSSPRHLISEPDQPWERSVAALNEGPEPFIHDGELSIVYSGNASWTTAYTLGILHLTGDDPLDRASWTKIGPAFSQNEDVYGPGHNSIPVTSPDGSESWLIYHAKMKATDGWQDRAILAQKFTWNDDGTPEFGEPFPLSVAQQVPSGEPCGEVILSDATLLTEERHLSGEPIELGTALLNTRGSFSVASWVRLDAVADQSMAILSQEGGISSNFVLGVENGRFAFIMYDGLGRNPASAVSSITPEAGAWVHLIGVHDLSAGELRLYVNGELQASEPVANNWSAQGSTIVGAARRGSQRVDPFTGAVRDIHLYNGALDADEITALAAE